MSINFEYYKVFYHVANTLSFSSASRELFISQSAVSQSIKTLEENLGCKLFIRHTKQVKLTQEGALLYKHIQQAYNFIKKGEGAIKGIHSLNQGEIRIGASDTICKYHLIPHLHRFSTLYPNIKIHVTNRTSPECIELLNKGSIDFCIVNLPKKLPYDHMRIELTKKIQDVFIGGRKYIHLKGKNIDLKDLAYFPLLMLERYSTTRSFFDDFLEYNGVKVFPEIELGSVDLLIEMTKIGLGLSFVISEYVKNEIKKGEIFMIGLNEKIPPRELGVVTHDSLPLSTAAAKFIEILGHYGL
jgi:DNA-binding transcriptional LysR family regulator